MLALMQSVAEAVMAKGVRGLAEWVPGGAYLFDVSAEALKRLKDRKRREEVCDELRRAAEANFADAKAVAEQVAREVASKTPPEERLALELYLSQVPGAVRKSMRRPEDHTGRSVPPDFAINTPDEFTRLLPPQMPRFRSGQPLPGRPGWTLLEPLGAGGFGEVWKVEHDFIPDVRAVKFCTDPTAKERLLTHEGKLIARVMKECRGPNVVALVDADLKGETPWLAYEYIGGGDLAGLILSWQKLDATERLKRAADTLRVLAETAGHFHNLTPPIVHRDLKPANILVAADGSLKITDFGIGGIATGRAASGSRDGLTGYTRAVSMLAGAYTPIYASPEQQRGSAEPDPRDDVHALGVIAYQMLTGRLDVGPGPRFDRDLKALGVPESFIELLGDCVDAAVSRRPRDGNALAASCPRHEAVAPVAPTAVTAVAHQTVAQPSGTEAENLARWVASGAAKRWADEQKGTWSEVEFQKLTERLKGGTFWPMRVADIADVLRAKSLDYWREVVTKGYQEGLIEQIPREIVDECLKSWLASDEADRMVGLRSEEFTPDSFNLAREEIKKSQFWPVFVCEYETRTALEERVAVNRSLAKLHERLLVAPDDRATRCEYLSKRTKRWQRRDEKDGANVFRFRLREGAFVFLGLTVGALTAWIMAAVVIGMCNEPVSLPLNGHGVDQLAPFQAGLFAVILFFLGLAATASDDPMGCLGGGLVGLLCAAAGLFLGGLLGGGLLTLWVGLFEFHSLWLALGTFYGLATCPIGVGLGVIVPGAMENKVSKIIWAQLGPLPSDAPTDLVEAKKLYLGEV